MQLTPNSIFRPFLAFQNTLELNIKSFYVNFKLLNPIENNLPGEPKN
jgi:hypothetical protein